MKMFDDLADPMGPPRADALGRVLARAHRRRVTYRSAAALIAVVAVVTLAFSIDALTSSSSTVRTAEKPGTSSPTKPTQPTTAPTTTTHDTTAVSRPVIGASWADRKLTITPRSLGRVRVGMTLGQAQAAAGVVFDGAADGADYPTTLPAGFPHLFVHEGPNHDVACVGAEIGDQATNPQTVVTPEGFRLGDTVQRLKAIYGSHARYSPAAVGGISPRAGYVVTEAAGNLAFYVDNSNTRVLGIKGGASDLTPSSCNG